jgi:hypothetical protein
MKNLYRYVANNAVNKVDPLGLIIVPELTPCRPFQVGDRARQTYTCLNKDVLLIDLRKQVCIARMGAVNIE